MLLEIFQNFLIKKRDIYKNIFLNLPISRNILDNYLLKLFSTNKSEMQYLFVELR